MVTSAALNPEALRRRAEVLAWQEHSQPSGLGEAAGLDPLALTLYELRVHQIELEMQNEELRQFQLDLNISQERYFDFYDMAPVGYCTVNDKGRVLQANLTSAKLLGVPRESLIEKSFMRFIEPADQDIFYLMRNQLIATQAVQSCELRLRSPNVPASWVSLTVNVAPTLDHGFVMHIVLNQIDERKRIELEVLAAKEYAENIVETVREPMLVLDAELKIRSANHSFYSTFGVAPENTIGQFVYDLGNRQWDIPKLRVLLEEIIPNTSVFNGYEVEHDFPGLGPKTIVLNARVIIQQTDNRKLILLAMEDITERKRISDALNASAARLHLMFDRATDGIVMLSGDGKLLEVNASFAQMHGYTQAEMASLHLRDLDTPEAVQKLPALLERVLAGETLNFEVTHYHKNGHIITLEVSSSLIVASGERLIQAFHRDITSRKQVEETVHRLAFYDLLTGLANRMLLKDRLARSMLAGERSGNYGALMFLDLDNFKPLNDQYGHGAGDLLLAEVAKRLTNCVRQVDTVARFGGDEFVVLLEDLTSDKEQAHSQADMVAGKIRSLLADPYVLQITSGDFGTLQTIEHKCTVSIGVALFLGQTNTEVDVLKWADLAMYKAKDTGRDRVFFFDHLMQIEKTNRVAFEENLREAILRKQFCIYYQAQISGKHEITGVEALLRWQHPTRGWVSPAEFIPTAEKTGLILPLGLWVLETACNQLALWSKRPQTAHLTMAINISAHQFHQADFVEQVLAVLARSGANPRQVQLELTENALITEFDNVVVKMALLKATGISFSLDDFGTGYSSLSALKRLPLARLKTAQKIVGGIPADPDDLATAKAVIALGDTLGLAVIAEGVETEAQRELLAAMGCHNFQGFLFSPALPADEFEALVARMRN